MFKDKIEIVKSYPIESSFVEYIKSRSINRSIDDETIARRNIIQNILKFINLIYSKLCLNISGNQKIVILGVLLKLSVLQIGISYFKSKGSSDLLSIMLLFGTCVLFLKFLAADTGTEDEKLYRNYSEGGDNGFILMATGSVLLLAFNWTNGSAFGFYVISYGILFIVKILVKVINKLCNGVISNLIIYYADSMFIKSFIKGSWYKNSLEVKRQSENYFNFIKYWNTLGSEFYSGKHLYQFYKDRIPSLDFDEYWSLEANKSYEIQSKTIITLILFWNGTDKLNNGFEFWELKKIYLWTHFQNLYCQILPLSKPLSISTKTILCVFEDRFNNRNLFENLNGFKSGYIQLDQINKLTNEVILYYCNKLIFLESAEKKYR